MPARKYRIGRAYTGLGLFATEPIRSREFIVRYSGPVITHVKADAMERYRRNRFLFTINKKWLVDGTARSNLARYVNHSCKPNAEAVIRRGQRRIDYVAARRIAPGEEITVDYGEDYTEWFAEEGGCKCIPCRRKRARKRRQQREARLRKTRRQAAKKRSARRSARRRR